MNNEEKNLQIMENINHYNKWQYDKIKKYIGKNILEIGAGRGAITKYLLNHGNVTCSEINQNNLKYLKQKFSKISNFKTTSVNISKKIINQKFDTIICINVLEHIKNDYQTIINMTKMLTLNGKIILIIPAFQSIYGTIDKEDNHYRRYSLKRIKKIFKISKLRIINISYMNMIGYFGWIYHGKILKLKTHNKNELGLFNKLIPIIKTFEKIIPPPFGLSLIAIGELK